MLKSIRGYILFILTTVALMVIGFQFLFNLIRGYESNPWVQFLINFPITLTILYINIHIVQMMNKWFENNEKPIFQIILDLTLSSAITGAIHLGVNSLFHLYNNSPLDKVDFYWSLFVAILGNCIIMLLIEVILYSQKKLHAEKQVAEAENEKIKYRYEALKAQVNPHFLFNSLNTLSALIYEDQEKASDYTKELSRLYRQTLALNNRQTVALSEEFTFLESYLYLIQMRFGSAIVIEKGDSLQYNYHQIIPMSIQLVVENAIKHNRVTKTNPLKIQIQVDSKGIVVLNNLQLKDSDHSSQFGLSSLQKRYLAFDQKIEIIKTTDTFLVRLPFL